jgi:hypothetical protein
MVGRADGLDNPLLLLKVVIRQLAKIGEAKTNGSRTTYNELLAVGDLFLYNLLARGEGSVGRGVKMYRRLKELDFSLHKRGQTTMKYSR